MTYAMHPITLRNTFRPPKAGFFLCHIDERIPVDDVWLWDDAGYTDSEQMESHQAKTLLTIDRQLAELDTGARWNE